MKATQLADPRPAAGGRLPTPPTALYPCCQEGCREERTWPPDDLSWFDGQPEKRDANGDIERFAVKAGWYCGECASEIGIEPDGPRLDEVLASNGQTTPKVDGDDRPACADCAFYAANAKASTDGQSRELLEQVPHEVADDDCCHPTSLIQQGTGQFDNAAGMRRTWCGYDGMLFTPWPQRQRRRRMRARVLTIDEPSDVGAMRKVRVRLESDRRIEIETAIGKTTAEKLALSTGMICSFTVAHQPDGRPDLDDWQAG